jgi:hypothetical protein
MSIRIRGIAAAATVALTTGAALAADVRTHDDNDRDDALIASRIRQGFAIAPVPLNLRGKNRALVGLGSYIVNAQGGCNDCHTAPPYAPGGNPFQGQPTVINAEVYLAGGTPFGPGLVSANITPDEFGRPAGLTREEFINTLRTGRDAEDPDHILQVMPWPVFGNMTDRDLRAVYEYLRSIPSRPDNF